MGCLEGRRLQEHGASYGGLACEHLPVTCQFADRVVRKYCPDVAVSEVQFEKAVTRLGIFPLSVERATFYSAMDTARGRSRLDFLVSVIMHGTIGSEEERLRLLFEAVDIDYTGEVTKQRFRVLAAAMVKVAFVYPRSVTESISGVSLSYFADIIDRIRDRIVSFMSNCRGVNIDSFLRVGSIEKWKEIGTPGGLRALVNSTEFFPSDGDEQSEVSTSSCSRRRRVSERDQRKSEYIKTHKSLPIASADSDELAS